MENISLLFGFEVSIFLIYRVNAAIQSGRLISSSLYDLVFDAILLIFSVICFQQWVFARSFVDNKINPESIFHRWGKKPAFFTGMSVVFLLILILILLPENLGTTRFIHQLHKKSVDLYFLLVICAEWMVYSLSSISKRIGRDLTRIGDWIFRNAVWIAFLILIIVKIILLVPLVHGILMLNDAYEYWTMANQIFHRALDIGLNHKYPPLYPAILSVVFLFGERYSLQHAAIMNVIISSSVVFPLYLLARQVLDETKSVLFIIVCALFPFHVAYPAILYSENLYYPLFFWTVYFAFSSPHIKRRTWLWDVFFALSLAALWLTRYMTLLLLPAFLIIWWIKPRLVEFHGEYLAQKNKWLRLAGIIVITLGLFSLWPIAGLRSGVEFPAMLGFASAATGNPANFTLPRLFFWSGISLAYLCLILAPVLFIFITKLLSSKGNIQVETRRWLVAAAIITISLMAIVTIYSWQAGFNFPEPTKYTGRYIIYISALAWLTALIIVNEIQEIKRWKAIVAGVLSMAAIVASYLVFFDRSWILSRQIYYFRFIDIFTISLLQPIFLVMVAVMIFVTIYLLINGKQSWAGMIVLGGIFCFNLVTWQGYIHKISELEIPGRQLDGLLSYLPLESISRDKPAFLYGTENSKFFNEELTVRGIDPDHFIIKPMSDEVKAHYNCRMNLVVIDQDLTQWAVIDSNSNCNLTNGLVQSRYVFAGKEYQIVSFPAK